MDHKKIKVDWDSKFELVVLRDQVNDRLTELEGIESSKSRRQNRETKLILNRQKLDEYILMYSDNPSHGGEYYVYAHCDPNKKIQFLSSGRVRGGPKAAFAAILGFEYLPFYIGKGIKNRAFELNRNETHRKVRQQIRQSNKEVVVKIVKENLVDQEALLYESRLIAIFGLNIFGGLLTNLDEGNINTGVNELFDVVR